MSADNPVGADQASNPLISNSQTSSILTSDSESAQDDREKKRKKCVWYRTLPHVSSLSSIWIIHEGA